MPLRVYEIEMPNGKLRYNLKFTENKTTNRRHQILVEKRRVTITNLAYPKRAPATKLLMQLVFGSVFGLYEKRRKGHSLLWGKFSNLEIITTKLRIF